MDLSKHSKLDYLTIILETEEIWHPDSALYLFQWHLAILTKSALRSTMLLLVSDTDKAYLYV